MNTNKPYSEKIERYCAEINGNVVLSVSSDNAKTKISCQNDYACKNKDKCKKINPKII